LATKTYVLEEISKINVGNIDLTAYATKDYVNQEIANIPKVDLTNYAKTEDITKAIADLVDTAPETLDTLGELAEGLKQNSNLIDTLDKSIANKANKTDLDGLASVSYVDNAISNIDFPE
jgi:hypothetical protein